MTRRANLLAPALLLAVAVLLLTLVLTGLGGGRRAAADMPYRAVAPQLVADDASGADADPNGPHTPTPIRSTTPTATPTTPANACGSGHAQLLTFTDAGAASIDHNATASTLGFLRTQPRPGPVPTAATRVAPVETALYTFQVVLDRISLLPNGTFLLIVEDPEIPGAQMRVDLPAPSCFATASVADKGAMNGARTALRLACGDPPASGSRDLAGTATITGPGYWGSTAVEDATPNGVEIGPLLGFTFTGQSCDPNAITPTPTPTPVLDAITVGVDLISISPGHPGDLGTAIVTTQPPIAGIECSVQYVNPAVPPALTGIVDDDPALSAKTTGADGTATWQWNVPLETGPGEGRFEAHCQGHEAVAKVTIVTP